MADPLYTTFEKESASGSNLNWIHSVDSIHLSLFPKNQMNHYLAISCIHSHLTYADYSGCIKDSNCRASCNEGVRSDISRRAC